MISQASSDNTPLSVPEEPSQPPKGGGCDYEKFVLCFNGVYFDLSVLAPNNGARTTFLLKTLVFIFL